MKTVFETQTYQVVLNPGTWDDIPHNYELVNKLYDVVEYTCMSLPQAIETAKMYEHYLQQDAEQPDLFEEYAKTVGTLQ